MRIEELGFREWGNALPNEGYDVFHSREALEVIDEHTSAELHLIGGFKGQQRIGLAPLFVQDRGIGRLVTSPPVGLGIGRLGPIVTPTSPKQRKREQVNREFTNKLLKSVATGNRTTLFRMSCHAGYTDPRNFEWAGLNVGTSFTYQLDLSSTTEQDVMSSFSRSRRREIRNGIDSGIIVRTDRRDAVERVYELTRERFEEQGLGFTLAKEYVLDLVEALGPRARVYTAETEDGSILSGMIILFSRETAFMWKGGTKRSDSGYSVSPNTLLHWKVIEDILTDPELEEIIKYDMYTANNERLVRYKSSFGGELVPYYTVESNGLPTKLAKGLYRITALKKDPLGNQSLPSVRELVSVV